MTNDFKKITRHSLLICMAVFFVCAQNLYACGMGTEDAIRRLTPSFLWFGILLVPWTIVTWIMLHVYAKNTGASKMLRGYVLMGFLLLILLTVITEGAISIALCFVMLDSYICFGRLRNQVYAIGSATEREGEVAPCLNYIWISRIVLILIVPVGVAYSYTTSYQIYLLAHSSYTSSSVTKRLISRGKSVEEPLLKLVKENVNRLQLNANPLAGAFHVLEKIKSEKGAELADKYLRKRNSWHVDYFGPVVSNAVLALRNLPFSDRKEALEILMERYPNWFSEAFAKDEKKVPRAIMAMAVLALESKDEDLIAKIVTESVRSSVRINKEVTLSSEELLKRLKEECEY